MNRRALTAMALLGFAIATVLPQIGFAQTNSVLNSLVGTWKLNLAKSTFSPGPAPRSQTLSIQAEGQGFRLTFDTVDAQGNSTKRTNVDFDDGKSHPVTGVPAYDAISLKTVNDSTIWVLRIKAGKVVQTIS
jgi:hypothetical protein